MYRTKVEKYTKCNTEGNRNPPTLRVNQRDLKPPPQTSRWAKLAPHFVVEETAVKKMCISPFQLQQEQFRS